MSEHRAFVHDIAYQEKVSGALMEALFKATITGDPPTAIWRSGDLFHVLTLLQAMVIAGSPPVSSPTKLREFCQDHARHLQRLIRETEAQEAQSGRPYMQRIVIDGELH